MEILWIFLFLLTLFVLIIVFYILFQNSITVALKKEGQKNRSKGVVTDGRDAIDARYFPIVRELCENYMISPDQSQIDHAMKSSDPLLEISKCIPKGSPSVEEYRCKFKKKSEQILGLLPISQAQRIGIVNLMEKMYLSLVDERTIANLITSQNKLVPDNMSCLKNAVNYHSVVCDMIISTAKEMGDQRLFYAMCDYFLMNGYGTPDTIHDMSAGFVPDENMDAFDWSKVNDYFEG